MLTKENRKKKFDAVVNSDKDFIDEAYYKKYPDAPKQSLQKILKEAKEVLVANNNLLFGVLGNTENDKYLEEAFDEMLEVAYKTIPKSKGDNAERQKNENTNTEKERKYVAFKIKTLQKYLETLKEERERKYVAFKIKTLQKYLETL